MSDILYHDPISGRDVPTWMSVAVDELLYKVRHKDIWQIVDFCIEIWAKKYPQEHKKFLDEMKRYKANRLNKFSSTKNNSQRELVNLPREIDYLLDKLAADKIVEYEPKKFYRELARRYPGFSPASSI
jgi:hypothetical protein